MIYWVSVSLKQAFFSWSMDMLNWVFVLYYMLFYLVQRVSGTVHTNLYPFSLNCMWLCREWLIKHKPYHHAEDSLAVPSVQSFLSRLQWSFQHAFHVSELLHMGTNLIHHSRTPWCDHVQLPLIFHGTTDCVTCFFPSPIWDRSCWFCIQFPCGSSFSCCVQKVAASSECVKLLIQNHGDMTKTGRLSEPFDYCEEHYSGWGASFFLQRKYCESHPLLPHPGYCIYSCY